MLQLHQLLHRLQTHAGIGIRTETLQAGEAIPAEAAQRPRCLAPNADVGVGQDPGEDPGATRLLAAHLCQGLHRQDADLAVVITHQRLERLAGQHPRHHPRRREDMPAHRRIRVAQGVVQDPRDSGALERRPVHGRGVTGPAPRQRQHRTQIRRRRTAGTRRHLRPQQRHVQAALATENLGENR